MTSIDLPDFYMPWPARLNPHLEGARAQSLIWVWRMEMLEPVWDEERFAAMDFALFAAWTHPDVPPEELNLLSNWYIWGWYVDDYFPQTYTGVEDVGPAEEYLRRLLAFMPTDGKPSALTPENPLECGLVDLWARTAPGKSRQWLRRYVATVQDMAEEALRELSNLSRNEGRVLDPIEYLEVRRSVGGILWSAQLVEHAYGLELPQRMLEARQLKLLNAAFADAEGLQNDLISYDIDMAEGKVNNAVTVVGHFLDREAQDAADLVNDLVTDRIEQFEHTCATELAPALDACLLSPVERAEVLRYVQGLKDWMAGNLEWALRPGGRYLPEWSGDAGAEGPALPGPTGRGTSAARLGLTPHQVGRRSRSYRNLPRQPREQIDLPDFYMPFQLRVNPLLPVAREHGNAWIRSTGITTAPGLGIWNEASIEAGDYPLLGAVAFPEAEIDELDLFNDWYTWGFIQDDYLLEVFKRRRDLPGAKAYLERLARFLPVDTLAMPVPTNPPEQGLADLWLRTAPAVSDELRRKLAASWVAHIRSGLWEIFNLVHNRVPELIDHMEMRRLSLGADVITDLFGYGSEETTPDAVRRSRPMLRLNAAVGDWAGWFNDVVSYQVEIEYEDDLNNGVLALRRFTGSDLSEAVDGVNRLLTARLREFEHLRDIELPELCDELMLSEEERASLADHLRQLEEWMAGFFHWHLSTGRYTDFRTRRTPVATMLRGPIGLGTSAARLRPGT